MGESRNAYRVLVGRPKRKRALGRPRRKWEDNIKMDLREVGYDGSDWINLAQDKDRWRAYVRAAMNLRDFERVRIVMKVLVLISRSNSLRGSIDNGVEKRSHQTFFGGSSDKLITGRSHLQSQYGDERLYHSAELKNLSLERIQYRAAKFVKGKRGDGNDTIKELKWETLENRRRKTRITSLYRAHLGQKAWVDITARLEKPTYYGRNDHDFKIKCRKQKTDVVTNHNPRSEELTGARQIHVEAELPDLFPISRIPSVSLHNFEGHQDCDNCAMLGRRDRMELSELFV
ncbi:hypothetical protein ANN_06988 [Periplaneta americana]|uniref:Uncharacterized protein n=1 Tax=Periplaneta americana TaxID=6978 RepID=A0ABQ8THG9_PERAM|nr:hypothetical protein ANN_06988 [Periplaneta americana]